jgi:signal transduction histidine kinase
MNLDMIKADLRGGDANLRRRVLESRQLAAGCAEEIRTLAYLLHPPPLKTHGLPSAVRRYVEGFMQRSRIHVNMQLVEVGPLPQPVETAFFRVVQESLTNIRRHASGSNAAIRLTRSASLVVLEVTDSGRRVQDDPDTRKDGPPATLGVGILGMEERIRQLGGTFDVAFTEHGTTVRAAVPVRSHRAHSNPRR